MKKRIIYIFIIIFLLLSGITIKFLNKKDNDTTQKNVSEMFLINKIQAYSSAMSVNNSQNYNSPEWNLDIYQYTDIAIYIDRTQIPSSSNYIKRLYIDNIKIKTPNKRNSKFILFESNQIWFRCSRTRG